MGWRRTSRSPREPTAQEPPSRSRPGRCRKAWEGFRSRPDESDSRLQGQHDNSVPYPERHAWIHHLHGRSQKLRRLSEAGFKHVARIQPLRSELRKGAKSAVPLADRAIGNLQQWLIGTYHGVKAQLQVYLDEFVFRHNRRKTPAAAFQSLLGLGTARKSTEYEQIRGARDLNPNLLRLAEATG